MKFFDTEKISCKPISNLTDLLNWSRATSPKYRTQILNESYYSNNENVPKFLVCHDMKNNYLEDKFYQGYNSPNSFSFYQWNLIDTFIYFSHHFLTIPPESWINAAHENNCRILGTLITEFQDGEILCNNIFNDLDSVIDKIVDITLHFGFDGWLVNIENKIQDINKLNYFVDNLTKKLKSHNDKLYQIIWYDSVIKTGELKWQNELNEKNYQFFEATDGFFVNYTWKDQNLETSFKNAKNRFRDVYVGIDVFGRGCLGNGGFNTYQALEAIEKFNLSYALFAPGWIHECNDEEKFYENSEKFWSLLQRFISRRKIKQLPLITNFSHASSVNFFVQGEKFAQNWNNLNLQSLLPVVENSSWNFDDGFYGSGSLVVQPGLNEIFSLDLNIKHSQILLFELIFKSNEHVKIMIETENFNLDLFTESNQIKILETLEKSINNWSVKRAMLRIENEINLKSIKIESTSQVNLGLLRLFEPSSEYQFERKIFKFNPLETDLKIFKLQNEIYLMIKLIFSNLNAKYQNIFINNSLIQRENLNGDKLDLRYIGSTKKDEFLLCLKMNSNIFIDSTNESKNPELKVEIIVQEVDHYFENLTKRENQLYKFDNDDEDKWVRSATVNCRKLKIHNPKEFSFIKEVIYDLEFF